MIRKLLSYSAVAILIVFTFTSCSRDYHLEFAGNYHRQISKNLQSVTAKSSLPIKEPIAPLATESKNQAFTSTLKSQPAVTIAKKNNGVTSPSTIGIKQIREAQKIIKTVKKSNENNPELKSGSFSTKKDRADKIAELRSGSAEGSALLCAIISIFIPPLGVALYEEGISAHFWIDLILTLLFYVPGLIYALIIILG